MTLRTGPGLALAVIALALGLLRTAAHANDEGIVTLSPPAARVEALDIVELDVVLDFSIRPAVRGGLTIQWDPTVFEFVSWDATSSTVGGEPPFTSPPVLDALAGTLSDARVGNSSLALMTPGVMATVRLRALATAADCGSSIDVLPSATNPWLEEITLNVLTPSYRRTRVAVGGAVCTTGPLATDVADMPGRCIGIVPPGAGTNCPNPLPADWEAEPMFGPLSVDPSIGVALPLADHMARYCVYDRRPGRTSDCETLERLAEQQVPGIVIESATMAAAVQGGDSMESLYKPALQQQFLEQAGQLSTPLTGAVPVRIGLIDTMSIPDPLLRAAAIDPVPLHGDALRRFASALLAGTGFNVSEGIALPFNCFTAETCLALCGDTEGCADEVGLQTGFLGTPESVARAIHDSLVRWSNDQAGARLVINASLGWLPQFNMGDNGPRAGFLALTDSLTEAACLGAIVIAAAGNANSGPEGSAGLMSPATEATTRAPDLALCTSLGYTSPPGYFAGDRPLVYPVGAVNSADRPLLARDGAQPPLVAFGDHASLLGPALDGGELPTLTGSSVASLVTAAAATAVWSLIPDASPAVVMTNVYDSARPIGRPADLCLPGTPCGESVRRVTVCEAYRYTCEQDGGGNCPDCPAPRPVQFAPGDSVLDDAQLTVDLASTRTVDLSGAAAVANIDVAMCNGGNYTLYQTAELERPLNPCPHQQFYSTLETPWATGQPEHQSCENCSMNERSPGKLLVEINDSFGTELDNPTLLEATLLCRDAATGAVNAFRLPDTDAANPGQRGFSPGEQLLISNVPNDLCAGDDIQLAFRVDAGDTEVDRPASLVQQLIVIRHDQDADGVPDFRDNCTRAHNDTQIDSDGDGYGNACDADIAQPNDCIVNALDLGTFRAAFFGTPGSPNWNPDADFSGDGIVNAVDLGFLRSLFFAPPGPSALATSCD